MATRNGISSTVLSAFHLISFHQFDRQFYKKTVLKLNQNHVTMKWIISLWLWMESIGHTDFIRKVASYADEIVIEFVQEGIACIQRINGLDAPGQEEELPLTNTLVAEPMDLGFFECHRDVAYAGISKMYDDVVDIVFSDVNIVQPGKGKCIYPPGKRVVLIRHPINPFLWSSASRQGAHPWGSALGICLPPIVPAPPLSAPAAVVPPHRQSLLNPMAKPWTPVLTPEEQRSMFITFSRGYPLTREEIMDFFTMRYGHCIEAVMIERARPGAQPVYGRLVLFTATMIAVVLNGKQTAKFMIRGKHLWARTYVPRQSQVGG